MVQKRKNICMVFILFLLIFKSFIFIFYILSLNICILLLFKFFYLTEKYLFRFFISGEQNK